ACAISSASITCKLGDVPKISVRLINLTKGEILLLPSLDGSDYLLRYPHCYFRVIGPDGEQVGKTPLRCGNLDTLQEKDFVTVPGGGAFGPYRRSDFSPSAPWQVAAGSFQQEGEYLIRFVYSTAQPRLQPWLGDCLQEEGRKFVKLLEGVPKTTVI